MSTDLDRGPGRHPAHGSLGYLQLPASDVAVSKAFYESVFGWSGELGHGSFQAPGLVGQWTTDVPAAASGGPALWLCVDDLWAALRAVVDRGGTVHGAPVLDQGERWLVEFDDPAGNRLGIVAPVRTARAQPMLAVRDVEASSRWYAQLLGLTSDHGGPQYERLLADGGLLVLQLHHRDVEHHHGPVIADADAPVGNGVTVWFGEVSDFVGVVARAADLGATVVIASPDGEAWH